MNIVVAAPLAPAERRCTDTTCFQRTGEHRFRRCTRGSGNRRAYCCFRSDEFFGIGARKTRLSSSGAGPNSAGRNGYPVRFQRRLPRFRA